MTLAPAASSVRPDELARYNRLAATWWNPQGPMRPLHVLNRLRQTRAQRIGRAMGCIHPLTGLGACLALVVRDLPAADRAGAVEVDGQLRLGRRGRCNGHGGMREIVRRRHLPKCRAFEPALSQSI